MEVERIVAKIRNVYPMSDFTIGELCQHFQEHQLPKHFLLTQPGIRSNHVFFIERGCSRSYLLVDGKELTNWFSMDGDLTFSSNSLYHRDPGFEYVQLLEDSKVFFMPIEALDKLYATNIEIANWSRVLHQEVLLQMQALRLERLSMTAKERYDKLINENSELFRRVNLGLIASYLGMTQQHLSTLRSKDRFSDT
jgi:CRP-like cAMP-binding protein